MAAKSEKQRLLIVDDDPSILRVLEARLFAAGYAVHSARDAEGALALLEKQPVDLIVSDVKMPGMGGRGLLKEVRDRWPTVPVILLTAYASIPDAVSFTKEGAADYLPKPFEGKELLEKIENLLKRSQPAQPKLTDKGMASPAGWTLMGGRAASMRKLFELIERVAPSEVNVLVLGESGTGKERVARMLHDKSPRCKKALVIVDCGSTPATLLESELFGHVKGSFTHAVRDKKGLIEEASGGTLFLDEIGNISAEMQTRLLRFLEERRIRRIGDTKEIQVSCRVVAATNADLAGLVREGTFREDLYYRLKGVTLTLPPLRDRRDDIPILAEYFIQSFDGLGDLPRPSLPKSTLAYLQEYDWPGNVRELKHVVEAAMVMCVGPELMPEDLQLEGGLTANSTAAPGDPASAGAAGPAHPMSLEDSEHQAILRALEKANWVQKNAADILGISRRAIHYKIKKYGIKIPGRRA